MITEKKAINEKSSRDTVYDQAIKIIAIGIILS